MCPRRQGLLLAAYDSAYGMRGSDASGIDDLESDPYPPEPPAFTGAQIFGIVVGVLLACALVGAAVYYKKNPEALPVHVEKVGPSASNFSHLRLAAHINS